MKTKLSRHALEIITTRLRLMWDASRLELLQHIFEGERTAQQLCQLTGLVQVNVSQHLGLMPEQELIYGRRGGSFVYFRKAAKSIYNTYQLACKELRGQTK